VTTINSVPFLIGFVGALVATVLIRWLALRLALLDHPNARSSHSVPVPRFGGLAIAFGTATAWAATLPSAEREVMVVAGGALLLVCLGLIDDLLQLSYRVKYGSQLVVSLMIALAIRPEFSIALPWRSFNLSGAAAILLALIWLTAIINAFNFMDGIDGIAGGVAAVTALGMLSLVDQSVVSLLIAMVAGVVGFLVWNLQPAMIFMGDNGSQFLGCLLGGAILIQPSEAIAAVPLGLVFAPFLADTGWTLVRRLRAQENVFVAHRSHLYQRLTILGYGHRTVSNMYYAAAALAGWAAVTYRDGGSVLRLVLLVIGVIAVIGFGSWISRQEHDASV
jgi:UDP-N-acetylmuramyl pentapeptide phosphotransferase/UDP-N-acetylglucosamine-1-phosphate transferase